MANNDSSKWLNENWYVSHWNYNPQVTEKFAPPKKVIFHDVTLRDGEQQSGVVFTKDDKVGIAEIMAEAGIQRIEAGMPAVSADDEAAVREIQRRNLGPQILSFCRAMPEDVIRSADCGVNGVVIEAPVNELLIKHGYYWSTEQALEKAIASTLAAKERGLYVAYFTIDGSRAEEDYYFDFVERVAKDGHMDSLVIVDTFSGMSPQAVEFFVRKVKSRINIPLEIHCHNALGMAVANSCAAVIAGAEVVHTTIGGIGEGAGNCPIAETAMALLTLYGIDTGIKYDQLYDIHERINAISGVVPNRPITGEMTYALEIGVGVGTYRKIIASNPPTQAMQYPIIPEFIGQKPRNIVLGKKSGVDNVLIWAERLGIDLNKDEAREVLELVKNKSIEKKNLLNEEEFLEIVAKVK